MAFYFMFCIFKENKSWHLIFYLAEDSHEMSILIFFEKKIMKCPSAAVVIVALKVDIWYTRTKKEIKNKHQNDLYA